MNTYQQISINYFRSNSPLSEDLFSLIKLSIEPLFMGLGYAVTIHKHDSWGLLPENGNLETSAYKVLKSFMDNIKIFIAGAKDLSKQLNLVKVWANDFKRGKII